MADDILDNDAPINPNNPLLDDLQGNILKGHGRDNTIHIFLRFRQEPAAIAAMRALIRGWANSNYITSARQQYEETLQYKHFHLPGGLFVNFFLSYTGYDTLRFPHEHIPQDPQFVAGMKGSQAHLGDPPVQEWDAGYRQAVDAMLLLADDDQARLRDHAQRVLKEVRNAAQVIALEYGTALRNDQDQTIEQFGYVDGRSQPVLLSDDLNWEIDTGGVDQYNPFAPLRLVLVRERHDRGAASFGSYLVFRKLEQNVHDFKETEEQLAEALHLQGEDEERAGALVVGRFEDGTPVTLQFGEGMHNPVFNNFDYRNDAKGTKCPLLAHMRQVNPRTHQDEERRHRIVRRGITYGQRQPKLADRPKEGVGLLFMCFQSDIAAQFEFLQHNAIGRDPIIGQGQPQPQTWPVRWGEPDTPMVEFPFYGFVTLKGGEYFFAPSMSTLRHM